MYHGPPTSAAVWPAGAAVSRVTVKFDELVWPTPLVAVTDCAPAAVDDDVQE